MTTRTLRRTAAVSRSTSEVQTARGDYATLGARLDGIDQAPGAARLGAAVSAGATAVTLRTALAPGGTRSRIVAIDPYTAECEVRRIATISGTTVNLDGSALDYSHSADDAVLFLDSFFLPAELFGAIPGGGDSATAINRGLAQLGLTQNESGGAIVFQPDTYTVNSSVHPPDMTTPGGVSICVGLLGSGRKTVIKWGGTFSDTAKILNWDTSYNNSNGFNGHFVKNLTLDGNDVALWGFYSEGWRTQCVLENVYIIQCVGSLYADDCWYGTFHNVHINGQTDGVPSGYTDSADYDRWAAVHNSNTSGPVFFRDANSARIDGLHITNAGVSASATPSGKARTYHALYLEGVGCQVNNVSFENTNGHPTTGAGDGVDRLISVGGHGIHFGPIYIESCHCSHIVYTEANYDSYGGLEFDSFYITSTEIEDEWFYMDKAVDCIVGNIYTNTGNTFSTNGIFRGNQEQCRFDLGQIELHEGDNTTISTKLYSDNGVVGRVGPWVADTNAKFPPARIITKVISGLTVASGSDATSSYVLVEPGVIETDRGYLRVGYAGDGVDRGWLLRLSNSTNYYIVVDRFGAVFAEGTGTPRETLREGKAILARAAVDGAGSITLTANYQVNTYDGVYINGGSNRAIYGSATPAAGFHSVGDLLYYTAPAAAGNIGEVCTTAGSPGTWKTWGAISA